MIPDADGRLVEWARQVAGDVTVSLAPPGRDEEGSPGVGLYLWELASEAPAQTFDGRRVSLGLRYLVTTWADAPSEAHRLLGDLVFAAFRSPDHEVDLSPVPVEVWRAFGVPPRPSFRLRVPVDVDTAARPAARVTEPLELHASSLRELEGKVVSAAGGPVPEALVEIPALDRRTRTDGAGRFRFPAVPSDPPVTTLRVSGKGAGGTVRLDAPPPRSEPLIIRVSDLEE